MQVIPVIDIKDGVCVRAVAGHRDDYRPMSSPLSASALAPDVVNAYLGLYPFSSLYVADLDAIERRRSNLGVLDALHDEQPHLSVWLDAGFESPDEIARLAGRSWLHPVIGSESQRGYSEFKAVMASVDQFEVGAPRLSLDFNADGFIGPQEIVQTPESWPSDLIVMTLDRVGVNEGPGVSRLQEVAALSRSAGSAAAPSLFAAGGVRGPDDLNTLATFGCAGVLVASALHNGVLDATHIAAAAG